MHKRPDTTARGAASRWAWRRALPACALLSVMVACTPRPAALLEISPAVVSECELPVAVTVRWDASALGLELAQLEVKSLGRLPRLWMRASSVGQEQTGPWAQDGFTVVLKAMNGVELGRRTLETTPCTSQGQ